VVICLERGADLHMAQRIPLPLTVSCFSKIQIGFTFLVPAHPGSPGQRAVKRVYVKRVYTNVLFALLTFTYFGHKRNSTITCVHAVFSMTNVAGCKLFAQSRGVVCQQ